MPIVSVDARRVTNSHTANLVLGRESAIQSVPDSIASQFLDQEYIDRERDEDKDEWEQLIDPTNGRPYYYNTRTRVSMWEKPEDVDPSESHLPEVSAADDGGDTFLTHIDIQEQEEDEPLGLPLLKPKAQTKTVQRMVLHNTSSSAPTCVVDMPVLTSRVSNVRNLARQGITMNLEVQQFRDKVAHHRQKCDELQRECLAAEARGFGNAAKPPQKQLLRKRPSYLARKRRLKPAARMLAKINAKMTATTPIEKIREEARTIDTEKWMASRALGQTTVRREEKLFLRSWFSSIDIDGSGTISCQELLDSLLATGSLDAGWSDYNKQVESIINLIDYNGNGEMDFKEMIRLYEFNNKLKAGGQGSDAQHEHEQVAKTFRHMIMSLKRTLDQVNPKNVDLVPKHTALNLARRKVLLDLVLAFPGRTKEKRKIVLAQLAAIGNNFRHYTAPQERRSSDFNLSVFPSSAGGGERKLSMIDSSVPSTAQGGERKGSGGNENGPRRDSELREIEEAKRLLKCIDQRMSERGL